VAGPEASAQVTPQLGFQPLGEFRLSKRATACRVPPEATRRRQVQEFATLETPPVRLARRARPNPARPALAPVGCAARLPFPASVAKKPSDLAIPATAC
jgi:hypothetical protein